MYWGDWLAPAISHLISNHKAMANEMKTDLPRGDQREIERILSIPVSQRTAGEAAFLSARAAYIASRVVELLVKDGSLLRISADRLDGAGYGQVKVTTNGTTPVNIFGAAGAPAGLVIKGIFIVSKDTTAGNIIVKQAANVVSTTAKGTVTGAFVDGGAISNSTYAKGDVATVESSSAGNADVYITFTIA